MKSTHTIAVAMTLVALGVLGEGCMKTQKRIPLERPNFSPEQQAIGAQPLSLDPATAPAMFEQSLPIDLDTAVRVALADNLDIQIARKNVEMAEGELESTVGALFPAFAPSASFTRVVGRNRNSDGNLFNVGFNSFEPSIAVQWAFNPGRVVYEIIAANKRIDAAMNQTDAVRLETLRRASVQFYELAFAQARIAAADQAVKEAEELGRISKLKSSAGVGVKADEMRADARLSERLQDRAIAVQIFYEASMDLARTLQIADPRITLVPSIRELPPIDLVRDDAPIEELLKCAVAFRPDLAEVRKLVEVAESQRGATWWGGFGPQFDVGYRVSGVTGHANNIDQASGVPGILILNPFSANGSFSANPLTNGLAREGLQRGSVLLDRDRDVTFKFGKRTDLDVNIAARWSVSVFGDLKSADAATKKAALQAKQVLFDVQTQVIRAVKQGATQRELVVQAQKQSAAAEEALRLTQANLKAGTMTTLDVLAAQDAVAQARLRYAEAVVRFNQAEINLLAALGILDQELLIGSYT